MFGYRTLSIVIWKKNALLFVKTSIFERCFGKYRRYVPFCVNIGLCLQFLKYALTTPPLGYCFVVFNCVGNWFLNNFFLIISARKSFSYRSICDKFIYLNKDSKFCLLWSLCRCSVKPQLNFELWTLSQTFYWRKAITSFQI